MSDRVHVSHDNKRSPRSPTTIQTQDFSESPSSPRRYIPRLPGIFRRKKNGDDDLSARASLHTTQGLQKPVSRSFFKKRKHRHFSPADNEVSFNSEVHHVIVDDRNRVVAVGTGLDNVMPKEKMSPIGKQQNTHDNFGGLDAAHAHEHCKAKVDLASMRMKFFNALTGNTGCQVSDSNSNPEHDIPASPDLVLTLGRKAKHDNTAFSAKASDPDTANEIEQEIVEVNDDNPDVIGPMEADTATSVHKKSKDMSAHVSSRLGDSTEDSFQGNHSKKFNVFGQSPFLPKALTGMLAKVDVSKGSTDGDASERSALSVASADSPWGLKASSPAELERDVGQPSATSPLAKPRLLKMHSKLRDFVARGHSSDQSSAAEDVAKNTAIGLKHGDTFVERDTVQEQDASEHENEPDEGCQNDGLAGSESAKFPGHWAFAPGEKTDVYPKTAAKKSSADEHSSEMNPSSTILVERQPLFFTGQYSKGDVEDEDDELDDVIVRIATYENPPRPKTEESPPPHVTSADIDDAPKSSTARKFAVFGKIPGNVTKTKTILSHTWTSKSDLEGKRTYTNLSGCNVRQASLSVRSSAPREVEPLMGVEAASLSPWGSDNVCDDHNSAKGLTSIASQRSLPRVSKLASLAPRRRSRLLKGITVQKQSVAPSRACDLSEQDESDGEAPDNDSDEEGTDDALLNRRLSMLYDHFVEFDTKPHRIAKTSPLEKCRLKNIGSKNVYTQKHGSESKAQPAEDSDDCVSSLGSDDDCSAEEDSLHRRMSTLYDPFIDCDSKAKRNAKMSPLEKLWHMKRKKEGVEK